MKKIKCINNDLKENFTTKSKSYIPFTIWLTGIVASGKTSLGQRLISDLKSLGINNIVLLDGEEVRKKLKNFSYSTEDRNNVGIQKALLALEYNRKGQNVIITGIAHHKETRYKIRTLFDCYSEVYLDCPVEVCAKRDYKGVYQKAFSGELKHFVGVTEPYEVSDNPDLILNTAKLSFEESAGLLLKHTLDLLKSTKLKSEKIR